MYVKNFVRARLLCVAMQFNRFAGTYKLPDYEYYKIEKSYGPSHMCTVTREEAITYLHDMWTIRRMEDSISKMYQRKEIRGFCHLYSGQEAIAVGIFNRMRAQDNLITSYRAHGYAYLFCGRKTEPIIAELAGLSTGIAKGKGGSMHIYADRFYGGNGIVAAQVPLGTGLGLAHSLKGTKGISFTCYGDGAANQGQVFESFNMAKLWALPIVFIVENNMYAMGTSVARGSAGTQYYKACVYIPGIKVDGMNILSVREATDFAIKYVTEGNGPIIIEMRTYRYFGHSVSDPGSSYRTRDEIIKVREQRDPIKSFEKVVTGDNLLTMEEVKKINKEVSMQMKKTLANIAKSTELKLEHASGDVVKRSLQDNIRGVTVLKPMVHKNFEPPA